MSAKSTRTTAPAALSPAPTTRLIPANMWNSFHVWPPEGGLRHLIFHAADNGFEAAIKRVGGRVLIDEAAFFRWVDAQTEQHAKRQYAPRRKRKLSGPERIEIDDAMEYGALEEEAAA